MVIRPAALTPQPDSERLADERLREILAAAEKATPGEWRAQIWRHSGSADTVCIKDETGEELVAWTGFDGVAYPKATIRSNARHIANCDPSTIAALASELLALREALAFYRDEFKPKIHKKQLLPGASNITFHPSEALLEDCGNRAMQALLGAANVR